AIVGHAPIKRTTRASLLTGHLRCCECIPPGAMQLTRAKFQSLVEEALTTLSAAFVRVVIGFMGSFPFMFYGTSPSFTGVPVREEGQVELVREPPNGLSASVSLPKIQMPCQ